MPTSSSELTDPLSTSSDGPSSARAVLASGKSWRAEDSTCPTPKRGSRWTIQSAACAGLPRDTPGPASVSRSTPTGWTRACRGSRPATSGDWSFLWQHRFTGPDVLAMLSEITVNSFATFDVGQSKHAIHTNRDGKVIHEGVLTRFGPEEFMLHGRGG